MKPLSVVIGGNSDIGKYILIELAKNGYDIAFTYFTNEEKSLKLKEELVSKYNTNVIVCRCDITNEQDINNFYNEITKEYSEVSVLINNACLCMDCYYQDKTKEEFIKVLTTNLVGPFLVIKKFNDIIKGTIINISSTDGIDTYNPYSIDYSSSKSALINMTKNLALVLENRIIALAPNYINTESVLNMDKSFLESELKRIGQKKLIKKESVALKIINIINDKNICSGSVVRMDE